MLVKCHLCSLLVQINHFIAHLKYSHKHEGLPRYKCAVNSCDRFFSSATSFRHHAVKHLNYPASLTDLQSQTETESHIENDDAGSHIKPLNYLNSESQKLHDVKQVSTFLDSIHDILSADSIHSRGHDKICFTESLKEPLNYLDSEPQKSHDVKPISTSLDTINDIPSTGISNSRGGLVKICLVESHTEPFNYLDSESQKSQDLKQVSTFLDTIHDIPSTDIRNPRDLDKICFTDSHKESLNYLDAESQKPHDVKPIATSLDSIQDISSADICHSRGLDQICFAMSQTESFNYLNLDPQKSHDLNQNSTSLDSIDDVLSSDMTNSHGLDKICFAESYLQSPTRNSGVEFATQYDIETSFMSEDTGDEISTGESGTSETNFNSPTICNMNVFSEAMDVVSLTEIEKPSTSAAHYNRRRFVKYPVPYIVEHSRAHSNATGVSVAVSQSNDNIPCVGAVFSGCSDSKLVSFESLKQRALALTLNFSADSGLSRIQVQRFVQTFDDFINGEEVNELKNRVLHLVSPDNRHIAESHFEQFQNSFRGINSEHKRLDQLEKSGYFIPPVPNFMGTMEVSGSNGTLISKDIYCQYIPIKATLKSFLENIQNFNTIHAYWRDLTQNQSDIQNIVQSKFWKSKHFDKDKIVFPIFLYQDDFETGNPLGSRAGIHKLCGVYMTIGCLPPEYCSKLINIFLVMFYHAADVKNYDSNIIYGRLIEDLNDLALSGIEIKSGDTKVIVYFKLAVIIGDNLGLNSTLGFTESFSAKFYCRFCKCPKDHLRELTSETKCVLRNKTNYETDLSRNSLYETGIRQPCVWNRVIDFHAVENYCVDIMHDLLEGVCKIEMAELLNYLIGKKKYFTLNTLNSRIKYFNRSVTSNAPPLISKNDLAQSRIKMTASEMKTFMLNAGVIFGDLITVENDEHWELYKLLRKILCICLKSCVSIDTASDLEKLITEHHCLYIKLSGKILKPKHHFMLHYGRIMREIGPLRHVWAMRFEAKHRPSKKNSAISFSRVNLCKTLAIQHQLYFGNALMENKFLQNKVTFDVTECTRIQSYLTVHPLPTDFHRYQILRKLMIESTTFKVNDVVVLRIEEMPVFCKIEQMLIKNRDVVSADVFDFIFIGKVFDTVSYNAQYQAHMVIETDFIDCVILNSRKKVAKVSVLLMTDGNKYVVYDSTI